MPTNPAEVASKLTVQCMVRNEEWTIWEALMSTVPFCKGAIIYDTGSTDRTKELIRDVIKRLPDKEIKFIEDQLPDMTVWGSRVPFTPSPEVGSVRNRMQALTPKGEFILTVDADEVYPREAMKWVVERANSMPPKMDCYYVPLHWMGNKPDQVCTVADPPIYWLTGRIFRNRDGYTHLGVFPGECAHFDGIIPRPGMANCGQLDFEPRMLHFEMTTKPWRRKVVTVQQYSGPIPEVFQQKKELLGWSLWHDFKPELIKWP